MRRVVLVALLACGCDNRFEARVGGAILPQAMGTVDLPAGATTVVVTRGANPVLPSGPVQLAIDVDVPWSQVATLVRTAPRPALVVGDRDRLRGFVLEDELDNVRTLKVTANAKGKFCMSPPGADEAYCVESGDRRHISAAFVRDVLQQAVREYDLHQAWVIPTPDLAWADLVRTIDGVRTCCRQPVKVALPPLRPAD
jgi:hypothetical protein